MADLHGGKTAAFETEDLEEEDVWAMMNSNSNSNSNSRKYSSGSSSSAWRRFTANPRSIPRSNSGSSGVQPPPPHSSAPVEVPDWDKILKKKKMKKNLWDDAFDINNNQENEDGGHGRVKFDDVEVYGDDGDDVEMVPPHEYLAKKLASTQIASYSMCEGVGRTLKGRDLSKLRNAILTKTGFLEK